MSPIRIACVVRILPGNLQEFQRQAGLLIAMVRDRESDTALVYEYAHAQDDPEIVHIHEVYRRWNDMRTHSKNVAEVAPYFHSLFEVVSLSICGDDPPKDLIDKYRERCGSRVIFYSEVIPPL